MTALLEIEDLSVAFTSAASGVRAVDGVNLSVGRGQTLGVVGESGSGKSTLAMAVLGLLPRGCNVVGGAIRFDGIDLLAMPLKARRGLLGRRIAYVPQEPLTALNPTLKVGRQVDLVLKRHLGLDGPARRTLAREGLEKMGIKDSGRVLGSYPFQLSGGQLQRVLLAQALALKPDLILADEPTTALDVTVQAEVLELLQTLSRDAGAGVVFISHNIAVVWRICDRIAVMQRGRLVETGETRAVISHPSTEYARSLLGALPSLSQPRTLLPTAAGEGA